MPPCTLHGLVYIGHRAKRSADGSPAAPSTVAAAREGEDDQGSAVLAAAVEGLSRLAMHQELQECKQKIEHAQQQQQQQEQGKEGHMRMALTVGCSIPGSLGLASRIGKQGSAEPDLPPDL